MKKILVWDWPVRIGHWLLVSSFVLAWLTSDGKSMHVLHQIAGAMMLGIISFRLVWGLIGTRHARFASFVRGPRATLAYVKALLQKSPPETTGHNPAGAVAILLLLGLGLFAGLTGLAFEMKLGGRWLKEVHETGANLMLLVVIGHLIGIRVDSRLHGKSLIQPMLDGHKEGAASAGIGSARPLAAIVLLGWMGLVIWYVMRVLH